SKIVKVAVVDKAIVAGKETTDAAYTKANNILSEIDSKNFADVAKKHNLTAEKSVRLRAMDNTLNGVEVPRELVRWVYESKAGDVTDKIFETNDNFIITKNLSISPKGVQDRKSVV